MTKNHHDTGYKELFSHPEFVQQLIEGFVPNELAQLMDFNTLRLHSGHYITPLFEEKIEDIVWSVEVEWQNTRLNAYLYLLIEFQSTVDTTMPIRLMHYVACFYDNLLKNKTTSISRGLPPVFPIVLYNGTKRWTAKQEMYDMIFPEPPEFLRPYQPHLRYYLIDEASLNTQELMKLETPLSGVFSIEKARSQDELQSAIQRIVTIIEKDPNKPRTDRVITRWLKRHLFRLGSEIHLDQIYSLTENQGMLAENLENWVQKERAEAIIEGNNIGKAQGMIQGKIEGKIEAKREMASNLIRRTDMDDQTIAEITDLPIKTIVELRSETLNTD